MTTQTQAQWTLDTAHSEIQFKVKHMMVSTVTGSFKEFEGGVTQVEDTLHNAKVNFIAKAASITTNNEQRDGHLQSADFFETENNPNVTFDGTLIKVTGAAEESYKLQGNLTMRGVTKNVEFDAEYFGQAKDPYGNTKAGFEVTGEVNRKDFGLNWNTALEAGGVLVSEKVKIHINAQLQLVQ